ncbi:hypothetical protein LTR37_011858 [Vermiconidia calcicola]|uniref:Uncharacterized protein n=1 Tax=Vermiconidia calcicola TaxID=1690605 RepID=A0ACC3N0X1_9PEZI|nr:hypothetical protein LTR37_011858 [Vermiconidia calcicola]
MYDINCQPAATPVAADTTVLTQKAYRTPNATTGTGRIPDVVITPPPASLTVPGSTGAYAEGTPFVYFSAYEIVTKSRATFGNGSAGCAAVTQTYHMAEAFSFEYAGEDVNGSLLVGAGVTGDVNPAFLQVVGAETAKAGSWVAEPTVAVVVQNIMVAQAVLAMTQGPRLTPLMMTQSVLQTPEATLPDFNTPAPPKPTGGDDNLAPPGFTGRIEVTRTELAVPTPSGTPDVGGGGPPAEATAGGSPGDDDRPNNGGRPVQTNGGVWGPIFSAIISVVKPGNASPTNGQPPNGQPTNGQPANGQTANGQPTNVLEIFSQALNSIKEDNPTALAIVNGLQGPNPTKGADSPNGGSGPGSNGGGPADENTFVGRGGSGRPIVVVGGTTFSADSATQFDLGSGATLTPGGTAVVGGQTVSLAPSLTALVINGETHMASPMITRAPVLTFGGTTFAPAEGTKYDINGQQLTPGGIITVDGTIISLGSDASSVVVSGETQIIAQPMITPAPTLTIGGNMFSPVGGTTYDINGQRLTPGGIITVDGTTISLGADASSVVVNGETQMISQPMITPAPALTIGGNTFSPIRGATYSIDGQQLTPGGIITADGTTISLGSDASSVVVNGETQMLSQPMVTPAPELTIDGTVYTPNGRMTYNIDGQQLTPGGIITVDGTTISLGSGASSVVINGETQMLSQPMITPAPVLTIGGTVYAPNAGMTYNIDGQQLTPGGVITVDGTTISLGAGASSVVVNGLTQDLVDPSITAAPVLIIGGQTFTATNGQTYVINGETLTAGEEETVTVNGKTYIVSLYPGATVVMIETEGPNGEVTATSYQTLYQGAGARPTITNTVSAGSRPSAGGPSQTVAPALGRAAPSSTAGLSAVCAAFATLALAIWL